MLIARAASDSRDARRAAGADLAQRQQLNQPERERTEQRQLQQIATDPQIVETPRIEHPAQQDRERAEVENAERPVMNSSVSERGKHDRDADHEKCKSARTGPA